jgi:hypothetical protein
MNSGKQEQTVFILIMLFTTVILCSCNDLSRKTGKCIDEEKSKYYRYGRRDKEKIFYFGNAYLGNTPKEIKDADFETFTILSTYWAKDKNAVYWRNDRITGPDIASFTAIPTSSDSEDGQDIIKDKNYVYYLKSETSGLLIVEDADPATFQDLGMYGRNYWAMDQKHIFLNYEIFNADRTSFEIIDDLFSKDNGHLFMNDFKLNYSEKVNADELKLLNPHYIRTNTHVYFFEGSPNTPVSFPIQDITSIEMFNSNRNIMKADGKLFIKGLWYKDRNLNVAALKYVGGSSYFNDGNYIFYCGWNSDQMFRVSSDVNSFATIDDFGKDSKHVYHRNKIIEDADPATFKYDDETDKAYDSKNQFTYDARQNKYVKSEKKK